MQIISLKGKVLVLKSGLILWLLFISANHLYAQADTISVEESRRIIGFLSSDKLKGRVNFTEGQTEAAAFIGQYFQKLKLLPYTGYDQYYQPFVIEERAAERISLSNDLTWNGKKLTPEKFYYNHHLPEVNKLVLSDFKLHQMVERMDIETLKQFQDSSPVIFWWKDQSDISAMIADSVFEMSDRMNHRMLFVSAPSPPSNLKITGNDYYRENVLQNIVGVLPGLSKSKEAIVFSAHYDHISMDADRRKGLFNGANDNASGVTALLQLANYYAKLGQQERTIIFIAFAGEEMGMLGSQVFTQKIRDEEIVAVVNIEMIGRHNKLGKNEIFITGQRASSMPEIISRNLAGTGMKIIPEKSFGKDLFARSDNFSFFKKGIPAHSIMSSDDDDPCYHQPCDDADTIDVENMTNIIRSIVKAASSLVNGTDTPVLYMKYEE